MSYLTGNLSKVLDDLETGIAYWVYYTSDSIGAVQAAGYIADATNKRVKLGDIVDVFSTSPAVVKRATALFGRGDVVNVHRM